MPSTMDMWADPMLRDLEAELAEPFLPEQISWRVGSTNQAKDKGMALAYIDARDVMERLDGVVGIANWQAEYPDAGNNKTTCKIGLYLDGQWVWKADGAGDTDFEGDKGAFSDAFKRAAVRWGIGRYLYGMKNTWVDIEPAGKSFKIKQGEQAKLDKAHADQAASLGMSTPSERAAIRVMIQMARDSCKTPEQVDTFIERNKGQLGMLRAAQKGEVWAALQAIKNGAMETA